MHKLRRLSRISLIAAACLAMTSVTFAKSVRSYVFFPNRPERLPDGLVSLKVQAPKEIDANSDFMEVAVLERTDGVRGIEKIWVKIDDPAIDWCGSGCRAENLGVVDRPAYIFGVFERGAGQVYFHAYRLPGRVPDWRHGRTLDSYIVDPAMVAKATAKK